MTQIHISIRKPKTGGLDPVTGLMRFRPVRRHFDAEKNLVIAASFDADLSETGELTVDLLPTTSAFVWQVVELADTPQAYTRYVEVPDSQARVEYADLVEVDAGTFVPKDMAGSQLLKVRHASTQSEAETLSAQYPDELVFFDETATTMKAAMAMSTLESITAEAQTNAALARSAMLSAQSSADSATATQSDLSSLASNASMAAASVANDSQTVADTANAVAAKGEIGYRHHRFDGAGGQGQGGGCDHRTAFHRHHRRHHRHRHHRGNHGGTRQGLHASQGQEGHREGSLTMPALYAGKRVGKPLMRGHTYNALFNGKLVWPLDKDTVVSIEITDDKGKPLPKSLAVSGTLKLGAKATYADGHVGDLLTTNDVTFTSRDTSTATVSGNTLTWRHGGTILVTATVNGFTSAAVSISAAYAPESIKVTDDSGKPIDNITLRVGESKNLKVTILPDAASQEYTASIKDVSLASVRQQ